MTRRSVRAVLVGLALAGVFCGCSQSVKTPPNSMMPSASAPSLEGTSWRLEELGGITIADSAETTLEFPESGKIVGRGWCNRFFGSYAVTGDSIRFGAMGSTRMACAEPLMNLEAAYIRALQAAERFTLAGNALVIYSTGMEKPLRFTRKAQ